MMDVVHALEEVGEGVSVMGDGRGRGGVGRVVKVLWSGAGSGEGEVWR